MSAKLLRVAAIALATLPFVFAVGCAKKPPQEPAQTDATLTPAPPPPPAKPPVEEPKETWKAPAPPEPEKAPPLSAQADTFNQQGVLKDIHFAFDKSDLTEESRRTLADNAAWMKSHPDFRVTIEGHCDERDTEEYNLALGDRRANSAREYLVSLGIAGTRLQTISYGEERPLDPGHTEEAWAKNRRAHFLIQAP